MRTTELDFSTAMVAEVIGATIRQLDYWARTGLLAPTGRDAAGKGSRRRYTFQDIVALQVIRNLRSKGCPLQQIRAAVRYLKKHAAEINHTQALASLTLLTDGRRVHVLSDEREVMEVVTRQSVWAIPLGQLITQARAIIKSMPQQWTQEVEVRGEPYHLDLFQDPDAGGYSVQCRELPGAIEQGETPVGAVDNGKRAIESVLIFLDRHRQSPGGTRNVQTG